MYRSAANLPERVQIDFPLPTLTIQSPAEECEINNILAKYAKTGLITHVREGGRYEDLPPGTDYHEAMTLVIEAQQSFEGLPATIRKEFGNDPAAFLTFVENPENVQRMGELGLLNDPLPTPAVDEKPEGDPPAAAAEGDAS